MGDVGEIFREVRKRTQAHRVRMLERANLEGWTRHTDYHYSMVIEGKRLEWWPSRGKARHDGEMIYGHRKVSERFAQLGLKPVVKP